MKKREVKYESKQELKALKWIKEGLTVRIICDKYKDGKMYNKKVVVKSVLS